MRQRYPFRLYAYVLISKHFHLLLEVDRYPTARILQSLLTGYVWRFNKTHHRRGFPDRPNLRAADIVALFRHRGDRNLSNP